MTASGLCEDRQRGRRHQGPQGPLCPEDTAYKVDQSVAVFNKITGSEQGEPLLQRLHRLREDDQPRAQPQGFDDHGRRLLRDRAQRRQKYPNQFIAGPDYSEMISVLLTYIAKTQAGREDRAGVLRHRVRPRPDRDQAEAPARSSASPGAEKIVTPPGSVDVSDRGAEAAPRQPRLHHLPRLCAGADLPEFMTQAKQLGMKTSSWAPSGPWTTPLVMQAWARRPTASWA
jgi:branched-chain amino acid transport system substrate-binding protein